MNLADWTMRDGKVVNVKTMTTLHVQNCVKMLKSNLELREKHRPMIEAIQSIVMLLEKTTPKNATDKSTKLLDQADTDLMMAEVMLDEQQEFTRKWISTFEEELYLRESN